VSGAGIGRSLGEEHAGADLHFRNEEAVTVTGSTERGRDYVNLSGIRARAQHVRAYAVPVTREEVEFLLDIAEAADAFVETTSYFRQLKASRPEFEALALALIGLGPSSRNAP
jgi:hypothetical protein